MSFSVLTPSFHFFSYLPPEIQAGVFSHCHQVPDICAVLQTSATCRELIQASLNQIDEGSYLIPVSWITQFPNLLLCSSPIFIGTLEDMSKLKNLKLTSALFEVKCGKYNEHLSEIPLEAIINGLFDLFYGRGKDKYRRIYNGKEFFSLEIRSPYLTMICRGNVIDLKQCFVPDLLVRLIKTRPIACLQNGYSFFLYHPEHKPPKHLRFITGRFDQVTPEGALMWARRGIRIILDCFEKWREPELHPFFDVYTENMAVYLAKNPPPDYSVKKFIPIQPRFIPQVMATFPNLRQIELYVKDNNTIDWSLLTNLQRITIWRSDKGELRIPSRLRQCTCIPKNSKIQIR